ncbi:MAG: hypothetical protein P1P82_01140 [Bacteroidales bacterium]|nr:hypothetical protein [Bacteroidales bacterium]MDT8431308.1 hypothetical protein [Bacteroidales bacterium]
MIYKFRIISDESKEFARELLIDSAHTFLDFHHCLQENLAYDPAQLASFFITNSSWEKQLQITLIDMMEEASEHCPTMDQCKISEHFSTRGKRMLYVFDFFSERSFFIELTEVIDIPDSQALPKVIFSHGDPPPQIKLDLDDLLISEEDLSDDFEEGLPGDEFDDDIDLMDTDDFPNE